MVNTARNLLIMLKNLLQIHSKLLQKERFKKPQILIVNKIADKITKVFKTSSQNNSEIVTNEEENVGLDRKIASEIYISPEKRHKILKI